MHHLLHAALAERGGCDPDRGGQRDHPGLVPGGEQPRGEREVERLALAVEIEQDRRGPVEREVALRGFRIRCVRRAREVAERDQRVPANNETA